MMHQPLDHLLANMTTSPLPKSCQITSLALDSRQVKPGSLFLAYRGNSQDGKQFLAEAIDRGAAAIATDAPVTCHGTTPIIVIDQLSLKVGDIAARFYDHPSQKMVVIGVTGTNGKSSVCYFLLQALTRLGYKSAIMSTLGYGELSTLQPLAQTTPDPISLQRLLAQFYQQRIQVVIIEVSSHALAQGRVSAITFDYAILTNISRDHLDYHLTMSAYAECKYQLFNSAHLKGIVLNSDDPYGKQWQHRLISSPDCYRYALHDTTSDCYANQITVSTSGITATISTREGSGTLKSILIGQFNVMNLLAVIATLQLMEIPLIESLAVLTTIQSPPGRMELWRCAKRPLVVVDYAHSPDALEKVLATLHDSCQNHLYCLFGCGGNRDRGKRQQMAAIAERYADYIIVTDDNPRYEPSTQIIDDILTGFRCLDHVHIEPDRTTAITFAITQANANDIVLLAGKGHERYQEIEGQLHPFDERPIIKTCFALPN